MNTTQISPGHPPDILQTPPRHLQGTRDANRWQQTPTETKSQPETPQDTDGCCLSMSGSVSWRLLVSFYSWRWQGGVWGTCGGVWGVSGGCRKVSECYFWKLEAHRCVLGSQPLQYGAITLFWHSLERHDFFSPDHSETSKYQNVSIWGWQKWLSCMISLFFNARQKDIKNGSCKWSPCSFSRRQIFAPIHHIWFKEVLGRMKKWTSL